jgi:hypothetical protein
MSRAIKITGNTRREGGNGGNSRQMASSCPTFSLLPPKAPAQRPSAPKVEPPSLLLPPSPSTRWDMDLKQTNNQSSSENLSRSLSGYAGFSCPAYNQGSFVPRQSGGMSGRNSFQPKFGSVTEEKLGSSPTVFSMLKEGSSPSSRYSISATDRFPAPSFGNSAGRSQQANRGGVFGTGQQRNGGGQFNSRESGDGLSDMLQFDLNIDDSTERTNTANTNNSGFGSLHPNLL